MTEEEIKEEIKKRIKECRDLLCISADLDIITFQPFNKNYVKFYIDDNCALKIAKLYYSIIGKFKQKHKNDTNALLTQEKTFAILLYTIITSRLPIIKPKTDDACNGYIMIEENKRISCKNYGGILDRALSYTTSIRLNKDQFNACNYKKDQLESLSHILNEIPRYNFNEKIKNKIAWSIIYGLGLEARHLFDVNIEAPITDMPYNDNELLFTNLE